MINKSRWQRHGAPSALATVLALSAAPAFAQSAADYAKLRAEVETLRAEQAKSAARLAQLEAALAGVQQAQAAVPTALASTNAGSTAPSSPASEGTATFGRSVTASVDTSPAAPINAAGGSSPGTVPVSKSKLTLNGDLRVRYESNSGDVARDRDRLVLRGRLRALYTFNPTLAIGGELSTGDAGDPNSTDITLTGFNNDLDASLSQAYIRLTTGDLTVFGGKIPQPFVRTELVWDGDINPTGVSAAYKFNLGAATSLKANALYSTVDENPAGGDSSVIGGQLALESAMSKAWKLELAGGYYHYRLNSTAGGDSGDFRTNRFAAGKYLSEFHLLDVVGAVQYNGFGDLWPVRVVGDYVHNFGATAGDPNGFGVDLLVGRASKKNDWRFGYGYAQTGVDAVFAAFSHDNTNIATNYIQHTAAIDYVPMDNLILNVTYYRYKPLDALYATAPFGWQNRLRLNMLVNF